MSSPHSNDTSVVRLRVATRRSFTPVPARPEPLDALDAVERATEFIMRRLREPLSVGRIAQASGLSIRTLYRLIQREYGVSPMVLLRQARLARARRDLLEGLPGTTVTQTALQWGFQHLGRFSGEYARRFGESPSETLRRARGQFAAGTYAPGAATPHERRLVSA